jgi:hypothetical protein
MQAPVEVKVIPLVTVQLGFAERLLHEMLVVDGIPHSQLRIDCMSHTFFHGVVSHKLSLV